MGQLLGEKWGISVALETEFIKAILQCCGESGYLNASIDQICTHSGGSLYEFNSHFASKEECFAVAYEAQGEWLHERLILALQVEGSRRTGLESALHEAAAAVAYRPAMAKALLLEVHSAGRLALGKRRELLDRFAYQVDRARGGGEIPRSQPTTTAIFIIGAVEGAFAAALFRGEVGELGATAPELAQLVDTALS